MMFLIEMIIPKVSLTITTCAFKAKLHSHRA